MRDRNGLTAEDIGAQYGWTNLLGLLRERRAKYSSHARQGEHQSKRLGEDEWYAILRCSNTDSPDQIRAKYLALVKQYHPDTIQAKGVPDAFVRFGAEQFRLIQEAYENISKRW